MAHIVNEYISEGITQDDTAVSPCASAAGGTEQKPLRLADVTTFREKKQTTLKSFPNPPGVHSNHLCHVRCCGAATLARVLASMLQIAGPTAGLPSTVFFPPAAHLGLATRIKHLPARN